MEIACLYIIRSEGTAQKCIKEIFFKDSLGTCDILLTILYFKNLMFFIFLFLVVVVTIQNE